MHLFSNKIAFSVLMNPLQADLDVFLSNVVSTQALFFQTTTHLQNHKTALIKNLEGYDPSTFMMRSTMAIGDLTGSTDKGWKLIYPTGLHHIVLIKDIEKSIDQLISREGMRSIAICYEILERFLFDITASFLFYHPQELYKAKKLKEPIHSIDDAKELIRRFYRSKNNKEILKLIKNLSQKFSDAECVNNEGLKLIDWHIVLSHVRHAIVHSLFSISKSKADFTPNQKEILKKQFVPQENEGSYKLVMTRSKSDHQITLIAEFGFLIFKCFSLELNYDWKVLKRMTR